MCQYFDKMQFQDGDDEIEQALTELGYQALGRQPFIGAPTLGSAHPQVCHVCNVSL